MNDIKNTFEITKILKSGTNRGNRRVWIEGGDLAALDWAKGVKFDLRIDQQFGLWSQCLILTRSNALERNADIIERDRADQHKRKRRVAGSDTRPIIDINAKFLNDLFGDATHFRAMGNREWIVIQPCNEKGAAR